MVTTRSRIARARESTVGLLGHLARLLPTVYRERAGNRIFTYNLKVALQKRPCGESVSSVDRRIPVGRRTIITLSWLI